MTVDAVITGSHVLTPQGLASRDIVIDEGRITAITGQPPASDIRIPGDGLVSIPGVIDTHVHYGVYSPISSAAESESHAAAIGGVTTMMRMLRLHGSYRRNLDLHLSESASHHYIDYAVHASIFDQGQAAEMPYCVDRGVSSFKIYMNLGGEVGHVYMDITPGHSGLIEQNVNVTDDIAETVIHNAAKLNIPVCVHAEDSEMCGCGIRESREKKLDGLGAWSASRPPSSEAKTIHKIAELALRYHCTVYFVHIGSDAALQQIAAEKRRGARIFVETCPHYLTLSHEKLDGYLAKVMPPVRSQDDVRSIWRAVGSGNIDTIGTDHVANRLELKLGGDDVWGALAGFPGIGVSLPILLSEGVNRDRITLERLAQITSGNAAQIFSLKNKGSIQPGMDADITMIDLKKEAAVSPEMFGGFSDYTVYEGWRLKGWPVRTIVRGTTVSEDFEVVSKPGHGRFAAGRAQ